jgi:hypothetical protein
MNLQRLLPVYAMLECKNGIMDTDIIMTNDLPAATFKILLWYSSCEALNNDQWKSRKVT